MGMVAFIWGILSLAGMVVAFLPCLGWLNWLHIPFSVVGLVLGLVANSKPDPGTRSLGAKGAIMCGISIAVGVVRLFLGGGIL